MLPNRAVCHASVYEANAESNGPLFALLLSARPRGGSDRVEKFGQHRRVVVCAPCHAERRCGRWIAKRHKGDLFRTEAASDRPGGKRYPQPSRHETEDYEYPVGLLRNLRAEPGLPAQTNERVE